MDSGIMKINRASPQPGRTPATWTRCAGTLLCALLVVLCTGPLQGQEAGSSGLRIATATPTTEKITLDGVLDEPAWQTAKVDGEFFQQDQREGEMATQQTEVWVLYDRDFLYVAAICHDSDTKKIVTNDISRDFATQNEDYFAVVLDTFNDDRNGYYLATTAVGGQKDSQISNEGRANNVNWDGVWYVESRPHSGGYTVEMAIPFKTLRFSRDRQQVWGVHFYRRMRGRNESTYWSLPPRRYSLTRAVEYAGELRGIENVEPGRNLQVKPYVAGGVTKLHSRDEGTEHEFDGGVDVKYGVTSGLVLDLTANTDFSHVEADTQQVNLTRFPLFFPEKREFFLENAGIFQFGALERNEALLFHSRTIGLEGGEPVPILGGARLSGRAGNTSLGLLNMQTRSEGSSPATNFSVARVSQNILENSNVGALFMNKQSGLPDDSNRAFGVDGNLLFFRTDLRLSALAAKTDTPGLENDDWIGKIEGEYQNNQVQVLSSYVDIGENFNPEMGFVRRRGRRIARNEFGLIFRQSPDTGFGSWVRDIFPGVESEQVFLSDGRTETKTLAFPFTVEFQDGSAFSMTFNQQFERLTEPFELPFGVETPTGDYRFNETNLSFASDQSDPIAGTFAYGRGDFFGGTTRSVLLAARLRKSYRFSGSVDYERVRIEIPDGAFTTHLMGLRMDYSFNPRMFLNSFIQYNNETNSISSNIRFRLIHRPLSDIYVVYNDIRDRRQRANDRSLTVKYTHCTRSGQVGQEGWN